MKIWYLFYCKKTFKKNCKMNEIKREISFKIGEKSFIAKFPSVGQIIDQESLKQALTSNRYGTMSASGVKTMYRALDLVDAIAFFQICVPSVNKFFDIKNYTNLQIDEIKDIVESYLKEIKPWYDEITEQLYSASKNGGDNIDQENDTQEGSK